MITENTVFHFSVNEAIWRIFMNCCMWAAVYLDHERDQFQRVLQNMDAGEIQQIFSTMQNQIRSLQQEELFGLHRYVNLDQSSWKSCTLLHKNIYKQFSAKANVFSDSVLCLGGKFLEYPELS